MHRSTLGSLRCIRNNFLRHFHKTNCLRLDPKSVEEIQIPVPWGHIAGEWWGSRDKEPIFALHGWQDNARTWQPLLTHLPDECDCSVLAIDLPGNGLSSHYPPFANYSFIDAAYILRRIQNYYKLKDMVLLGHSGGSFAGFLFSSIFPESVRGFMGIDFLLYAYKSDQKRVDRMAKTVDKKVEMGLRDHEESPTYEWDVAKQAIIKATKGSVNDETADILMKRGMVKKPDGKYSYLRDTRHKTNTLESLSIKQAEQLASSITAHTRLIRGSNSPFFDGGIKNVPHVLDIIKSNAKSFELHTIEGSHHLHMDSPQAITPHLVQLLKLV